MIIGHLLQVGYIYQVGTSINVFSQYNWGDSNNSGVENLKKHLKFGAPTLAPANTINDSSIFLAVTPEWCYFLLLTSLGSICWQLALVAASNRRNCSLPPCSQGVFGLNFSLGRTKQTCMVENCQLLR